MPKISRLRQKAFDFWQQQVKQGNFVISSKDFPDEYCRRFLLRQDLLFQLKSGLYLLKNKGQAEAGLVYQNYWQIIKLVLANYEPWSIEKKSALNSYLGDESIPHKLMVRTKRNVKYAVNLPFGNYYMIRPDTNLNEKTRQAWRLKESLVYLDIPERVLLTVRQRNQAGFMAFLKATKFDSRFLDVLYSKQPKPVAVKEIVGLAKKVGRLDLANDLAAIYQRYTVYRV